MKLSRLTVPISVIGVLVLSIAVMAQNADKEKLIDIERAFAGTPNPGAKAVAVAKEYDYAGSLSFLTITGLRATLSKPQLLELNAKPNPADPDVRSTQTLSDIHVDLYGDTALVNYKQTETDAGHKNAALNRTSHIACLDTFVKRSGRWYLIGGGCASTAPITEAEQKAVEADVAHLPKDVQQTIH